MFIWGGSEEKSKCHLVGWHHVIKEKENGGLGIRATGMMNMAFMAILGWRMITEKEKLWSQILMTKYIGEFKGLISIKAKNGSSNAWCGIAEAITMVKNGFRSQIHNGQKTKFLHDCWADEEPLSRDNEEILSHKMVDDYWSERDGWDWNAIGTLFPEHVLRKIEMKTITDDTNARDELYWTHESSSMLSVKSAYSVINGHNVSVQDNKWKAIWKTKVPNKMKMLVWLIMNGRVLCNAERKRRHMTQEEGCSACNKEAETVEHDFRKCNRAYVV